VGDETNATRELAHGGAKRVDVGVDKRSITSRGPAKGVDGSQHGHAKVPRQS
jgi:hypothetical protein